MNVEKEIDVEKSYLIPDYNIENYKGIMLVILKDSSKWIILKNKIQFKIFDKIAKKKTIFEILNEIDNIEEDLMEVLIQIEAKKFWGIANTEISNKGLFIYLTNKCNLACPHCYLSAGKELENELTKQEIIKVLNDFKSFGGESVTFSGGEVTEKKNFLDIIKAAGELNLKVTILTNGIKWNEEIIKKIANFVSEVQISIDGYDEKSNSLIRGKGNFQKALNTINIFLENKVKTSLAITPSYEELFENEKHFFNFSKKLLEKYPDNFSIKYSLELMEGRDITISKEKNKKYNLILSELIEKLYPNYFTNNFALNYKNGLILKNCGYGEPTIASNGDIYFCNLTEKVINYSNVRETTIEDIMKTGEKIKNKYSVDNISPCKECSIKYICNGGCRYKYVNLNSNDDLYRYNCSKENKEFYFDLMIKSNNYLYEE